jgi:hypothetical protein
VRAGLKKELGDVGRDVSGFSMCVRAGVSGGCGEDGANSEGPWLKDGCLR